MRVQPLRVQVEHSAAAVGKSTLVRGNPRLVGPCRASISATPPLHSWAHALSWLRQKPVDKSLCVPGYRCFLCSRSFPMSIDTTLKTLKGRRNLTPICPSMHLFPRLPSLLFQSCFIQASDRPVELSSTAQRPMYILASGHASLHAKLMDEFTAH